MLIAESALALRNPIYEAEYSLEEKNPLKLYDCFVPHLEEHRKVKNMTLIEQLKHEKTKRRLHLGVENTQLEMLKADNRILE